MITSQQARAYKPDLRGFNIALERMGCDKANWLHIGESLYHDIGPANRMGIASVLGQPPRPGRRHAPDRRDPRP